MKLCSSPESSPKKLYDLLLPWLVGMTAETCLAVCSVMLSGILEKVPKLKVMFSHSGGAFPSTIGRIEWGYNPKNGVC